MTTIDATLIPVEIQQSVIQGVIEQSVALKLATVQPMPTGAEAVPVLGSIPTAGWTAVGGRKPTNTMSWTALQMKAEEIAATIDVPTAYIDDAGFPLWESIQPMMTNALARAIDAAVLLGTNAPASFPVGGVRAFSTAATMPAAPANDVVGVFNAMLETVEHVGLNPGGFAADVVARGSLRGARISTGAPLWVPSVSGGTPDSIYGYPVQWSVGGVFDLTASTGMVAVTGDWNCLRIGVRRDVTVDVSAEAVLADGTGKVLVSAFQDDKVIMRVHMRLGCVIGKPFTTRANAAVNPFSHVAIGSTPGLFSLAEGEDVPDPARHSLPADENFDPAAPTPPVVEGKSEPKSTGRRSSSSE